MSTPATAPASTDFIEEVIRRNIRMADADPIEVEEVEKHTNLNYVYKASLRNRSIFVKVVPERPKRLPSTLPRERVFAEAEAMRRFAQHAGAEILVPDVLFVDAEAFAIGMSDVGEGRDTLIDVLGANYSLLASNAACLGRSLALVHQGTVGMGPFRPDAQDSLLRTVVFQGLLGPGARTLFPGLADSVLAEMDRRRVCLVHADLWGKNILVGDAVVPAVVDFEGAFVGDPALDVATILAVALLPALEDTERRSHAVECARHFLHSYSAAHSEDNLAGETATRAWFFVGVLLAARGFGPFAYPMSTEARTRVGAVARNLIEQPAKGVEDYLTRIGRSI